MTIMMIDGALAGQRLEKLPKGYHCVLHLDNHPDLASSQPEFQRAQLIDIMLDGVTEFTDEITAVKAVNRMRHGTMTALASHVLKVLVDANEAIHELTTMRYV